MSESRFSVSQNEEGLVALEVTPAAGEEAEVGRLIDYLTPTTENDKLQPAKPDETGEIRRTLAPGITVPQVGFILDATGFKLG